MIELKEYYNQFALTSAYSNEVADKLRNINGRKWDYNNKCYTIPKESLTAVYDTFDNSFINATPYVKKCIKSLNGKGNYEVRRIAFGILEVYFHYREDIASTINRIVYKHKVDVNRYTMSDDDVKFIIRILGRERATFATDKSPFSEKYSNIGKEILYLTYNEPFVEFECDDEYGKYLHENIPQIVKNYKSWKYEMPLHVIPDLIGFVGKDNVITNEKIDCALKDFLSKELPIKERLKDIKPIRNYSFKTAPLPHQIEAFNEGVKHNRLLIADTPGLGKTYEALNIACYRSQKDTACLRNVLIVCGVNSVKYNWVEEIKTHTNEQSVVFEGKPEKKIKMIEEWYKNRDVLFGIINIEALRNEEVVKKLNELVSIIIVDEIHKAKNGNSQQGKALRNLNASIKIGLSGTPMTNKPEDLWNILAWLDIEHRNFYQFRNAYCVMGGYNDKQIVDYKNLDDLALTLKEVMLRRKKEDVVDLPPKTYETEYVELSTKQKSDYQDAKNQVLTVLDKVLNSSNPLTYLLRLRQVTSGLFAETKDNAKFSRIKDIVENTIIPNGDKVILFTQYEEVAKLYRDAFSEYRPAYIVGKVAVEERQKEVNRFQTDDSCKISIGTIGAMGTGLTMTAASYVIFIDKDWAQTNNEQAEDRAHRIGTQNNVTIISMVAKGTIDEHIEKVLKEKAMLFENIVEGKAISSDNKKALVCKILDLEGDN